jgi:hypothetical protein
MQDHRLAHDERVRTEANSRCRDLGLGFVEILVFLGIFFCRCGDLDALFRKKQ